MTDQPADDGHAQQAYAEQMHRTLGGLNAKVRELGQQLRAAEDELQMLRPLPAQLATTQTARDQLAAGAVLVCSDERHAAKVRGLEAALGQAEARIAAAISLARHLQRQGNPDAGGIAQRFLLKLGVPWDDAAGPSQDQLAASSPTPDPDLARAFAKLAGIAEAADDAIEAHRVGRGLMVYTGPAEEAAGEQATLDAWLQGMRDLRSRTGGFTPEWLRRIEREGMPTVVDERLPAGEIHLRPRTKAEQEARFAADVQAVFIAPFAAMAARTAAEAVDETPAPTLTVRMMTPPPPACPDCGRPRHGGYTCEEFAREAAIIGAAWARLFELNIPHLGAAFIDGPAEDAP